MHEEIAFGGSGGQGVLFIGRLLAEAALREDREVVWMPSYGGEKRGGSVYCSVIISDERIGAIVVARPDAAVAMNLVWSEKFEPIVKRGGLLIANQSLVRSQLKRNDIQVMYLAADELAAKVGNRAMANLVALGTLIKCCPVVSLSSILAVLNNMLARDQKSLELNKRALERGVEIASKISLTSPLSDRTYNAPYTCCANVITARGRRVHY